MPLFEYGPCETCGRTIEFPCDEAGKDKMCPHCEHWTKLKAHVEWKICYCQLCNGRIEFPDHGVGEEIDCPHCKQKVILSDDTKLAAAQKKLVEYCETTGQANKTQQPRIRPKRADGSGCLGCAGMVVVLFVILFLGGMVINFVCRITGIDNSNHPQQTSAEKVREQEIRNGMEAFDSKYKHTTPKEDAMIRATAKESLKETTE